MNIFGWIMLSLLAIFGLGILIIFAIPFVVSEIKAMQYKIKKAIEDKKSDIDKRSDARKHRDEVKRQKDFELANKKLDARLQKVDKQIELQQKKLALAKELKKVAVIKKEELIQTVPTKSLVSEIVNTKNNSSLPTNTSASKATILEDNIYNSDEILAIEDESDE